jgi:hypothetical protein
LTLHFWTICISFPDSREKFILWRKYEPEGRFGVRSSQQR